MIWLGFACYYIWLLDTISQIMDLQTRVQNFIQLDHEYYKAPHVPEYLALQDVDNRCWKVYKSGLKVSEPKSNHLYLGWRENFFICRVDQYLKPYWLVCFSKYPMNYSSAPEDFVLVLDLWEFTPVQDDSKISTAYFKIDTALSKIKHGYVISGTIAKAFYHSISMYLY